MILRISVLLCVVVTLSVSVGASVADASRTGSSTCGFGKPPIPLDVTALCRSLNAIGAYVSGGFTHPQRYHKYFSEQVIWGNFIVKAPWPGSSYQALINQYQLLASKKVHGQPYYVYRVTWQIDWMSPWKIDRTNPPETDSIAADKPTVMSIYGTQLRLGR